jgi:uncharacterized protein YxeA
MKNFIKVYYPVILIVLFSMIIGGFIEREIISSRYDNYMQSYDSSYRSDSSMDTKSMIIYGNCQDCY